MKRTIIFIAALALLAFGSNAQTTFGVRAGINFQNINGKDSDGDKLEFNLMPGFHVGANAEIPVAPDFYFQPGLLFSTKGAKEKEGDYTARFKLAYLELPLHVVYKPQLGSGKLILGFGPYLGYAIKGKLKAEYNDVTNEVDIKFKNKLTEEELMDDNIYMRPLDAGANIFFGYEFAFKVSVQLNTQLGLINMDPSYEGDDDDKSTSKNTGFGFSVGYRF